ALLQLAIGRAAVSLLVVAVVAFLAGVGDAVAAERRHAGAGAAGIRLGIAVAFAVVADLARVDHPVTAVRPAAIGPARVDLGVAAAAPGARAVRAAIGEVRAVALAVVALLARVHHAVTATRRLAVRAAGGRLGVAVVVAVVALLVEEIVRHAVATARRHAVGPSRVRLGVAVVLSLVALLEGLVDDVVAATRARAVGAAGVRLDVAVVLPLVAGLAAVLDAVSAVRLPAVRPACVRLEIVVVRAVVAFLPEEVVRHPVAAGGQGAKEAAGIG